MYHPRLWKKIMMVVVISVLALFVACYGPAGTPGPAGPPGPPGPAGPPGPQPEAKATIVAVPDTASVKGAKVMIFGSGFTAGSVVTVGFPYVPVLKGQPEVKGLWVGTATANEYGSFSVECNLAQSVGRLVSNGVTTEEEMLGVHTLIAKTNEGVFASTPFIISEPKTE